jgi:probable rRNA maturation factor
LGKYVSEKHLTRSTSENMLLGDIAISYNSVLKESAAFGKSIDARVSHLFVHGVLHVLGYDHIEEQDRNRMETLETEILAFFNIENPYILS